MTALANILIVLAVLALLADWRQTLRIFAPGSRWRELNPAINWMVGRFGAPTGVHLWFGMVCVLFGAAVALLEPEPRLWLAVATAAIEGYWVLHNLRKGISL